MTSSVMSIWALLSASASASVMKGFNVPKARECSRTRIRLCARPSDPSLNGVQDLAALLGIGGVHVEEQGLPPLVFDLTDDPIDIRLRGLPIQMHAHDVHPETGELQRGGLAEPAGSPQDECPGSF